MRNSKPSGLYTAIDMFHTIGGAMHNRDGTHNRDNYQTMKINVEGQISQYETAITEQPITLERIKPLWANDCAEKKTAHDMYKSEHPKIQEMRNDLMRINGAGKVYKCPICECDDVVHLDHYIPRDVMPEFSVMPQNLIYLCDRCNTKKDTLWLDDQGNRIIFNAYYDRISGVELLSCKVEQVVNNLPFAELDEKLPAGFTPEIERELETLRKLELIDFYAGKVNEQLQTSCKLALASSARMKGEGNNKEDIWNTLCSDYRNLLSNTNNTIIEKLTFEGLINSSIMKDWLDNNS